jgi:histidine ammonia-lyase
MTKLEGLARQRRGNMGTVADPVVLDGRSLDPEIVEAVAEGAAVSLDPKCREAMRRGREIVERYLKDRIPAYGINTGLGLRSDEILSDEAAADFAYRMVRGRAQGLGPPLSPPETRAVIVARLNTLLSGEAGASLAVADCLAAVLNRNVVPAMPRWASIGAGDLVAMAALAHALIGEGEVLIDGERLPAADGLKRAGLERLVLKPKDGPLLCNITSFSVGLASLVAARARRAVANLQIAGALSLEGLRGNVSPFEPAVVRARPQPGQVEAGDELIHLLEGGLLRGEGAARRLQDPLSLRCMAQVHGAAYAQIEALHECLAVELNHAADNPVVLIDEGRIAGTGNFHLPLLAQRLDAAARALAFAATDSVSRVARLMSPQFSGLPPLLSSHETARAGFGPLMKPAEALRAEILHLANPVPILPSHNADGQEDAATFSAFAAQKLGDLLDRLDLLIALELLAGAQAVDLAGLTELPARLAPVQARIRAISRFIDDDRPLGREIEKIAAELVRTGELVSIVSIGKH